MTHKVLCTDGFSTAGLTELNASPLIEATFKKALTHEELLAKIEPFEALVVRSASKVSRDVIEAGKNLKIIARAGVGTDNIDAKAATERGIYVVNTPAGNTTSTAELAFAMLLSLARHIPGAHSAMTRGVWEKKKFMGTEVAGKTLGIIGMGRIGSEMAKRARVFRMNVIAFDPALDEAQFAAAGAKSASLDELCRTSDFITIHAPLIPQTQNLIGAKELATMKKTARIINCARGGIVNEDDLAAALKNGTIAGAALDVYTKEPYDKPAFQGIENIILTPHLGASTTEAQDAVAIEAARSIIQFFDEGLSAAAVNLPSAGLEIEKFRAHILLAEKLGLVLAQICKGNVKKISLLGKYALPNILTLSAAKGAMLKDNRRQVSLVNAMAASKERGISLSMEIADGGADFADAFGVAIETDMEKREAWGAVLSDGSARIVRLDSYRVEILPKGPIVLVHNTDKPGVIGDISSLIGRAGINIAEMQNVRRRKGAEALTIVRVDTPPPADVLKSIAQVSGVTSAVIVEL